MRKWLCCSCHVEDSYPSNEELVKSPRNNTERLKSQKASAPVKEDVEKTAPPIEVPALSLDELKEKTDNFGSKALIGEGSYGRVYYATLENGKAVAVKKLDVSQEPESNVEFLTQVSRVSTLKHENIVELQGYCVEGNMRVLAYEFATMGSLHDILHGRKGVQGAQPGPVLDWVQRVRIAVDAARGLEYLHEKVQPCIIHRDIRSSNVLLFEDFRRPSFDGRRINASRSERELKRNKTRQQTRRWASTDVPILPYAWFFQSRNISKILQFLQILAAIACVVLSTMKLIMHNFGEIAKGDSDKRNRKSALYIFYGLALAEASLFLFEKIYWELNAVYVKVLEKVNEECEFGPSGMVSVRRFFYDAYSRCVDGSVFDGLKMDMVSFAMELLGSHSPDEQLMGARILRSFAMSPRFSDDTLQKLGVNFSAVGRLLEILNWNHPGEEEIRRSAAEILSKLAGKKQNSLRVTVIPGALESISSLLYVNRTSLTSAIDEVGEKGIIADHEEYGYWTFNHLGLMILKKLARDHDNCGKIGNTRGLLPKIIDFACAGERLLKDDHVATSQIQTVKRSLQVIKMLASTTGSTGNQLRKEISENVFTFTNIRDILKHGEKYPDLQKLGIEILTSLAMEDDATQIVGATGGIIKELLNIFFKDRMPLEQVHVRTAAGEALVMLALESKQNSNQILKLGSLEKLVKALDVPLLRLNAGRILRNLCTYSADDYFHELRGVIAAVPTVLKGITSGDDKLREVMVGLAARAAKFITHTESDIMFERSGVKETEIANVLVQILKKHPYPNAKFPRIRRFTIELAVWMMTDRESNVGIFRNLGLENELLNVLDTTSEIESFHIFSGTVGLSRFRTSMQSLAETALNLLSN